MDSTQGSRDGLAGDWVDLEEWRLVRAGKDFENTSGRMLRPA
jgi:hypothetical protein